MNYHMTLKSSNTKTGPMPVTTTGAQSCPDACKYKGNGCYAESGPLRLHWDKVTRGERGYRLAKQLVAIRSIDEGALWRLNQAGDLPGIGDRINSGELRSIVNANAGKRGFTYTHKPVHPAERTATTPAVSAQLAERNRAAIRAANAGGFTINLSANDLRHADKLSELKIAPVAVVLPLDAGRESWTPAGRRVVTCPATYRDDITCKSCGLCQVNTSERPIIGFPAHGSSKRRASAIAEG